MSTTHGDALVFTAAGQRFALSLTVVREVLPRATVARLPDAPDELVGILRLRGTLLPVVDLRRRLGLPAAAAQLSHRIVVTQAGHLTVGLLVDAVDGLAALGTVAPSEPGSLVSRVTETPDGIVTYLNSEAVLMAETAAFLAAVLAERAGPQPGGP